MPSNTMLYDIWCQAIFTSDAKKDGMMGNPIYRGMQPQGCPYMMLSPIPLHLVVLEGGATIYCVGGK